MSTNSIQPWASGSGSNRMTDAAYNRWDKSQGFVKGTASSEQANTLWAANSLVASAIGQFTADGSGTDVSIDMSRDDLVAAFKAALSDFMMNGQGSGSMVQMPVGTPIIWHSDNIPDGTLLMNGQAIDPSKYPKLHAVYGDNLPDWRGYFLRAADGGRGIDEDQSRAAGSTQDSANKAHNHGGSTGESGGFTPSGSVSDVPPHSHSMHDYYDGFASADWDAGADGEGNTGVDTKDDSFIASQGSSHSGKYLPYMTHPTEKSDPLSMSFTGDEEPPHVHTITNDGGKESRPVNISVNYIVVAA